MTRPPAFEILTTDAGAIVTVEIHGELDLATAPKLEAELERIGALPELARAVIDLRFLQFLDSTGLPAIVGLDRAATERGAEVVVVRGPRAVERLFAVMQLDRTRRLVAAPEEPEPVQPA